MPVEPPTAQELAERSAALLEYVRASSPLDESLARLEATVEKIRAEYAPRPTLTLIPGGRDDA